MLKKILATASVLAVTATGFSIEMPFFISYDFDSGAAPTVTAPAGAFASVSDFTGGTVAGSSMSSAVSSQSPATFQFSFTVNAPYTATILAIGYNAIFDGQIGALAGVGNYLELLDQKLLVPSTPLAAAFLTPTLTGLSDGNIWVQALGLGNGTFNLKDFNVIGSVSMADAPQSPARVPDSSTSVLGLFTLIGLVAFGKRFRKQAA